MAETDQKPRRQPCGHPVECVDLRRDSKGHLTDILCCIVCTAVAVETERCAKRVLKLIVGTALGTPDLDVRPGRESRAYNCACRDAAVAIRARRWATDG